MGVISREPGQLHSPIGAVNRLTAQTADALRSLQKGSPTFALELAHVSRSLTEQKKYIDEMTAILQANVKVHPFLLEWMLVMMVTFAEAYLESVLLILTAAYPA